MTGKGESVVMTVKVLDIENNNAVLFEQVSTDTPDADDFQTGTDSPAAPFLGKPGNFVLLLYHNDTNGSLPASTVTLDNAKVFQYEAATVDDFDDNKVNDWEKFDFKRKQPISASPKNSIVVAPVSARRAVESSETRRRK